MPECPLDQSYATAYAKIVPVRLKHVAAIGPGAGSKAVSGIGQSDKSVHRSKCRESERREEKRGNALFRRVRASLSQKLMVPSEPQVENVPCTGWKVMSFTA